MPVAASVTCAECGATYMRRDASDDKRHVKTQKHIAGAALAVENGPDSQTQAPVFGAESERDDDLDDSWDDLDIGNLTPTPILKPAKPKAKAKPAGPSPVVAGSKECRVCHKTKALALFRVKASRPDGRDTICASCAKDWLVAHKAKATK